MLRSTVAQWFRVRLEAKGLRVQHSLYPRARHIILCLVLVEHRKIRNCPEMTEKNVDWEERIITKEKYNWNDAG